MAFVTKWRTNTGFTDLDPLPFDYRKELVGGRTPCLLGPGESAADRQGSSAGAMTPARPAASRCGPKKKMGLWDFPLQQVPVPRALLRGPLDGLQHPGQPVAELDEGARRPTTRAGGKQATDAYIAGFQRAYETNRAPFFIGNHFEQWNGGIYMDAVEEALKHMADEKNRDVRLVSFRQFTDWLDAQDPEVLAQAPRLAVGQRPVRRLERVSLRTA